MLVPTPKKGKIIKYNKITITPIAIRFNQKPHLAITGMETCPLDIQSHWDLFLKEA